MVSAENGGGQHPTPEGRKIGTRSSPPGMFMTPSLNSCSQFLITTHVYNSTLVHNDHKSCSKLFLTTLDHNTCFLNLFKTLVHNFCSTNFVHNFSAQFLSHLLFTTHVYSFCSKLWFTNFAHNSCSQFFSKLLFTALVQHLVKSSCSQLLLFCSQLLFRPCIHYYNFFVYNFGA